jgi:hypothetical protein
MDAGERMAYRVAFENQSAVDVQELEVTLFARDPPRRPAAFT